VWDQEDHLEVKSFTGGIMFRNPNQYSYYTFLWITVQFLAETEFLLSAATTRLPVGSIQPLSAPHRGFS